MSLRESRSQSVMDSLADAEQLRPYLHMSISNHPLHESYVARRMTPRSHPDVAYLAGVNAAHSAFIAVPALRQPDPPNLSCPICIEEEKKERNQK